MKDGWAILRLLMAETHPRRVTEMRSVVDFYVRDAEPPEAAAAPALPGTVAIVTSNP